MAKTPPSRSYRVFSGVLFSAAWLKDSNLHMAESIGALSLAGPFNDIFYALNQAEGGCASEAHLELIG
jgi:hypothetical protein